MSGGGDGAGEMAVCHRPPKRGLSLCSSRAIAHRAGTCATARGTAGRGRVLEGEVRGARTMRQVRGQVGVDGSPERRCAVHCRCLFGSDSALVL